ncbi:MAG TPA: type 1 periplasmic binding fold superfamily protein, partial [Saprospiraceae bacterium]|nr:type 1 periplasmic binding fold superfamily protein [Saprospiraceae bacterium]
SEVTLSIRDLDGDGGNAPIINVSPLRANTVYNGELSLLNEAESPAVDITKEVKDESKEHQFFFESSLVKVSYTDQDSDGNPLGLTTQLTTTNAGTGKLKITLRHEPNKKANGVKDGLIANAGGETDIEVEFNITVQ